jgi:hypothetical protein
MIERNAAEHEAPVRRPDHRQRARQGGRTSVCGVALERSSNWPKEWIEVHEEETTKRVQIKTEAEVKITEINARRDLFLSYLDKTFDEREKNFEQLFARWTTPSRTTSTPSA